MNFSQLIYKLSYPNPAIEFGIILGLTLFFPSQTSFLYFTLLAGVMILFSIRNIWMSRNISVSRFSYLTLIFNITLLISIFFSTYHLKSILFFSDLLLISFYLIFLFTERRDHHQYINSLLYLLTAFSIFHIFIKIFPIWEQQHLFLGNPIFQGIASGIAVLIACFRLIERFNWGHTIFLLVNAMGVFISESKASYLGIVIFCLYMILLKRKKWIPILVVFVILTFLIPNPIKNMFIYSITKDPYSTNRLNMWEMCVDIFQDHPVAGVGLDNFVRVSKQYNFKQKNGPANYFKAPRMPHSDYFKLLAEMGSLGILVLLFSLYFILRICLTKKRFDISKVIILYILFQALFINLVFRSFFFFLILFLIKTLSERRPKFLSLSIQHKFVVTFLFLSLYTLLYIFPFISHQLEKRLSPSTDIVKATHLLNTAQYLSPLDHQLAYRKAIIYLNYFKQTSDLDAFRLTLDSAKRTHWLNPHHLESYMLEAELFSTILSKGLKYPNLKNEIITPIESGQKISPFNPFLRLTKAEILREFGDFEQAKAEALAALEIEPEFVRALYFLHRHFDYIPDPVEFERLIDRILAKSAQWQPQPGTYLFQLFAPPSPGAIQR